MHFERSNATIPCANAPQARKRYYNKPQRRFPSHKLQKKEFPSFRSHNASQPNLGTPPFLAYFFHTSNEKQLFFICLGKSNVFVLNMFQHETLKHKRYSDRGIPTGIFRQEGFRQEVFRQGVFQQGVFRQRVFPQGVPST